MLLARLRSGHPPSLHQYLQPFNPVKDPICPSRHLEEQDLAHWLCDCPAGGTEGPWSGLLLNLGIWWHKQGRPWSTLTLNQVKSSYPINTLTHMHNYIPI